jgi:hypothetical protein
MSSMLARPSRPIAADHGALAEQAREAHHQFERRHAGLHAAHHLDQLHARHRVHEMHACDALGPPGDAGDGADGDGRRVRAQDRVGLGRLVEAPEQLELEVALFARGLDHDIDIARRLGRHPDATDRVFQLLTAELALGHQPIEARLHALDGLLGVRLAHVAQHHLEALSGADLRDARPHLSCPYDADSLDLVCTHWGLRWQTLARRSIARQGLSSAGVRGPAVLPRGRWFVFFRGRPNPLGFFFRGRPNPLGFFFRGRPNPLGFFFRGRPNPLGLFLRGAPQPAWRDALRSNTRARTMQRRRRLARRVALVSSA